MIHAQHLHEHIGGKTLLHDVSIAINPGQFTAVVGPNGAGKSTLLKILSGARRPASGTVTINGVEVQQYSAASLSLVRAVLPQSVHVPFAFTVKQMVMLGRHTHRTPQAVNERIVEEVMALTNTLPFATRLYQTLSGGEQQRVQFARVLAQVWDESLAPRYVLLDEPTASLDLAQQQFIFRLAREICSRNLGVLAIVHDLNQAAQYADNLYFLREGRMVAQGAAADVFTRDVIEETFCCRVNVYHDPCNNCPYILPDNRPEHVSTLTTQR